MRIATLIALVVAGLVAMPARADWMLGWVDADTGFPLEESEIHVPVGTPFDVGVQAVWFAPESPEVFGYEMSFSEEGFESGGIEFGSFADSRAWPITQSGPSDFSTADNLPPALFDPPGDSGSLALGTLTLTAVNPNVVMEEDGGEIEPWEVGVFGGLQTSEGEPPVDWSGGEPLRIWTDGGGSVQPEPRDLIPPIAQPFLPPVTQLFFNPDPGNVGNAAAETVLYFDDDPHGDVARTTSQPPDEQPASASQTTSFGPYGDNSARATAQGEVLTTDTDGFVVLSMTSAADVDLQAINANDRGVPSDPFEAGGTVDLQDIWVWIGPDGEYGYGDTVMVTASAGEDVSLGSNFLGSAAADWNCAITSRITGQVVGELDRLSSTAVFPIEVGDDLIITTMLEASADTGPWAFNFDNGLYYAGEGHAAAAVDVWITTQPVPEPSTLVLLALGAVLFAAARRRLG